MFWNDSLLSLDKQLRREVGLDPHRAGLGSFFVTLDLVTEADGERGWLAKSLEAQECRADSSQPGVLGWVVCIYFYS